jgi:tetratricopeptide (TPR) repeat protein
MIVDNLANLIARRLLFSFLALSILLSLSPIAPHAEAIEINADGQLRFADSYFEDGNYPRAIAEYERFLHFFPKDDRGDAVRYQIGTAFFEAGRYRDAIDRFSRLAEAGGPPAELAPDDLSFRSFLMIAESYVRLDARDTAVSILTRLLAATDSPGIADEIHYRIAWIQLRGHNWRGAKAELSRMERHSPAAYPVTAITSALEEVNRIPQKSPAVAGLLSVMPGAGYLYCGRYQDALTSFLFNGALILSGVEAFDSGNEALGGLIGFVGVGFYSGSIYGSISAAHKYNRSRNDGFVQRLQQSTGVDFRASADGVQVSFRIPF